MSGARCSRTFEASGDGPVDVTICGYRRPKGTLHSATVRITAAQADDIAAALHEAARPGSGCAAAGIPAKSDPRAEASSDLFGDV